MSKLNHALPAGVAGLRIGADVNAAHVLSFAALFVALGGMAYALSANQVKSKHIAAGAVKLSDLNKKVRTEAFQVTDDEGEPGGSFNFDDADALITSLPLKKGSYVISSTFQMQAGSSGLVLRCQLRAGSSRDEVEHFGFQGNESGALGVAHKFGSNGTAQLRCLDGSAPDNSNIDNIEIIATKVMKVKGNSRRSRLKPSEHRREGPVTPGPRCAMGAADFQKPCDLS